MTELLSSEGLLDFAVSNHCVLNIILYLTEN